MKLIGRHKALGLASGWVRINSPRAASSVYPFTPEPVDNTKFADDPYLYKT